MRLRNRRRRRGKGRLKSDYFWLPEGWYAGFFSSFAATVFVGCVFAWQGNRASLFLTLHIFVYIYLDGVSSWTRQMCRFERIQKKATTTCLRREV
jgi:hypothetical protein